MCASRTHEKAPQTPTLIVSLKSTGKSSQCESRKVDCDAKRRRACTESGARTNTERSAMCAKDIASRGPSRTMMPPRRLHACGRCHKFEFFVWPRKIETRLGCVPSESAPRGTRAERNPFSCYSGTTSPEGLRETVMKKCACAHKESKSQPTG